MGIDCSCLNELEASEQNNLDNLMIAKSDNCIREMDNEFLLGRNRLNLLESNNNQKIPVNVTDKIVLMEEKEINETNIESKSKSKYDNKEYISLSQFEKLISQKIAIVLAQKNPSLQQVKNNGEKQLEQHDPVIITRKDNSGKDYYHGSWDSKNQPCGLGTLITSEGSLYKGYFDEGLFNGRGILITPQGDYYLGDWSKGNCNGKGETYTNNYTYLGEYKDNIKCGKGKETFADGTTYEGDFNNNERHGKGKLIYLDGSSYEGDFNHSVIDGFGEYSWSDKRRYKGQFENGLMSGKGVYQWKDGSQYNGNYLNNKKQGNGKYTWTTGTELIGNWINNEPSGNCVFFSNGMKYEILFRFGKIISAKKVLQVKSDVNVNAEREEKQEECQNNAITDLNGNNNKDGDDALLNSELFVNKTGKKIDLITNKEILNPLDKYTCRKCEDLLETPYTCDKCFMNYCFNCIYDADKNTFVKCLNKCENAEYDCAIDLLMTLEKFSFECKCKESKDYNSFIRHQH